MRSRPLLPILTFPFLVFTAAFLNAADTAPSDADEHAPARKEATGLTWVIIHGAWGGGWEWKPVGDALEARGHTVYRPTHTGLGERHHLANPGIDLETHIDDVANLILWEQLEDVVLLGHSYGGMVMTGVVDRLHERVRHVIYLDAALPVDGESLHDTFGGGPCMPSHEGFTFPGEYDPDQPLPHIVPQSDKTFYTPIQLGNEKITRRLPTTYLLTADDPEKPERDDFYPSYQRARSWDWETQILKGGHALHLEQPTSLANRLHTLATQAPPQMGKTTCLAHSLSVPSDPASHSHVTPPQRLLRRSPPSIPMVVEPDARPARLHRRQRNSNRL